MTEEQEDREAFAEALANRMRLHTNGAQKYEMNLPAPHVEVEAPNVEIDMKPVAEAIDRMTAAMEAQTKTLGKLIDALAARPAHQINVPEIKVPAAVNNFAPQVHLPPPRKKRIVKDSKGEPIGLEEVE